MTEMRSSEHIPQGYMFLLGRERTICRQQVIFRDSIDAELLQQAVDALMRHTDYFNAKLICEDEKFFLCQNEAPCVVYAEDNVRQIPEETNGYLFYVSYRESTLYLTFWHFLTDGRGAARLMNELLREYSNRRYRTAFACGGLYTDGAFSFAEMKEHCADAPRSKGYPNGSLPQNGPPHHLLIRLLKKSVLEKAAAHQVWPVSYLLYVLGRFAQREYGEDLLSYDCMEDARDAFGVPNALYNCSSSQCGALDMRLNGEQLLDEISDTLIHALDPKTKILNYVQSMDTYYDLYRMQKPMRQKRMINDLVDRMSQMHFVFSYLGEPISRKERPLNDHILDYHENILTFGKPLLFAETTFGDYMNVSVYHRFDKEETAAHLHETFESEGITVSSVEITD